MASVSLDFDDIRCRIFMELGVISYKRWNDFSLYGEALANRFFAG
jgi:hypothetical protein